MYYATIPATRQENAKNYSDQKPLWYSLKLLAIVPPDKVRYAQERAPITELVDLRVWGPKSSSGSRVYSSVWIHSEGFYSGGTGTAGGYGYCKSSAAAYTALRSAGIEFTKKRIDTGIIDQWHFHGAGMSEVETALYAIGEALGFDRSKLYVVSAG